MPRVVKSPDERRRELIAGARTLFYTKGYESTSVSDIVEAIGVSKGTFYYYFDSKSAILEAMVEELTEYSVGLLHEIVEDERLNAIDKWVQGIRVVSSWKTSRKTELLGVLQMLQSDENLLLQYKTQTQAARATAPELAKIVTQGVREGVFDTAYEEEAGAIAFAIMQSMYDLLIDVFLNPMGYADPAAIVEQKVIAVQTAVERVLGAPQGSLPLTDAQTLAMWFLNSEDELVAQQ